MDAGASGVRSARGLRPQSRPGVVLVALAAVLALVALTPAAAQGGGHIELPEVMPGDWLLVSHRSPEGNFELHRINWDASDRTVLTPDGNDFAATWSPDGRHIAFHRVESPADGLYVVTDDGERLERLDDWGATPSWAPDSTRMVHSPSREGAPRPLHIVGLDGSVTPIPGTAGGIDPVWSPTGAWVAYVDPDAFELVVVRPDGSDRRVIAPRASFPTWSPDSAHLAYVERGAQEPFPERLVVVRRDGAERRALAEFVFAAQPAFSPSGRDIAVSASTDGTVRDIWRVEVATGQAHRRTDAPTDEFQPHWTAGGSTIVFTRAADQSQVSGPTNVWATNWSGGPARQVTDTGADLVADVAPGRTLRLAGVDRVHTALALSRTLPAADTVVIARADDHPDALAGGPLAAALNGPVLLTGRDGLHPALPDELRRLGADRAYLLGGHEALSPQVEADLAAAGVDEVTRLAGADRFATAARVAAELRVVAGDPERVFVVEGRHPDPRRGWPDALSASGVASLAGEPILLVTRDRLPTATRDVLAASGAEQAVIVGGPGAVSEAVAAEVDAHVADVARVSGADRYETSVRAADLAVAAGADAAYPWLATGRNWPDALAAAPATARDGGVLVLVDGATWRLPDVVDHWLTRGDENRVLRAVVVGGPGVITPEAHASIEGSVVPVP